MQREYEFTERRENPMFTKCHLTVYNQTESKMRENPSYTTNIEVSLSGIICWILGQPQVQGSVLPSRKRRVVLAVFSYFLHTEWNSQWEKSQCQTFE